MPKDSDGHLDNPLCSEAGLPAFDRIAPEHVVPAVRQLLERSEEDLAAVEERVQPTWSGLIEPLDEIDRRFEQTWSPVGHLFGVKNSTELREAYEAVLDDVVAFGLRSGQSEPIYKALKELRESDTWNSLDEGQRRIVEQRILSAELAGHRPDRRKAGTVQRDCQGTLAARDEVLEQRPGRDQGVLADDH